MQCPKCEAQFENAHDVCPTCGYIEGTPKTDDRRDQLTTLLLAVFLGKFGIDRFYTGHTGMGVLKLCTLGCCGVLWIYDIITIVTGAYRDSEGRPLIKKL